MSDVLTVSTKGQVVLPRAMREELGIESGTKLIAYSSGDAILLKKLPLPSEAELLGWLEEMRGWASEVGLTERDIAEAIAEVRKEKRA